MRDLPGWMVLVPVGVVVGVGSTGAARRHAGAELDLAGYGMLGIAVGVLALRRRWPVGVLAVVAVATSVYWLRGYVLGPSFLPLLVAVVAAVVAGRRWAAWGAAAGVAAATQGGAYLFGGGTVVRAGVPSTAGALGVVAWALLVPAFAELVRFRVERTDQARRVAAEEHRRRGSEERLRMARELHDVLAHNISMINVRAGVALHLLDEQPEQAREALTAIKAASKEALTEMRSVISLLRQEGDTAPRSPAAGLGGLPDLLKQASFAGLDVVLDTTGDPRGLPANVDLATFRIVQESLTNVTRHATSAARVTVRLDHRPGSIRVRVADDGSPAVPAGEGQREGNGVAGMRERAAVLGGTFTAGTAPDGGFVVEAVLPWKATE
ncbi:sensor histidine kinase [Actinocorallia longicatena]|uniref:histidine kinase n=1 Tax=Actinocorallia longicatena TaxID=111803 RepID=A0ABP6Q854_9ACTN